MWSILRERLLWKGILGLVVLGLAGYVVLNHWLMPSYTRHGVSVAVPDTKNLPYEKAARVLEQHGLQAERGVRQYDPSLPREVVLEQNPEAHQQVKPGRRVYLNVNSGDTPRLRMPNLVHLSRRQAINQIEAHQLQVGPIRIDSIPSPYKNTVTRQRPAPGDTVRQGSSVRLWISPGQGEEIVEVPDVRGIPLAQADSLLLLAHRLRTVLVNDTTGMGEQNAPVRVSRQRPQPGTSVRAGTEIRLTVNTSRPLAQTDSVRAVLDSILAVQDSVRRARADSAVLDSLGRDSLRGAPGPGFGPGSSGPSADTTAEGGQDSLPPASPQDDEIPREF